MTSSSLRRSLCLFATTRRGTLLRYGALLALVTSSVLLGLWWFGAFDSQAPSPSFARAQRRAYHGAPPVIPHPPLGGACISCHGSQARELPGVGIAPANPHRKTSGLSESSRCAQCHLFKNTSELFVVNTFQGTKRIPYTGERLYRHAPPVMPHGLFMREDCTACHSGAAARPAIRCSHPERRNCLQCHLGVTTSENPLPLKKSQPTKKK